ncbi:MAG TPA: diguanylate cyclase [Pyrinomonadaceae bacterium]|nr:diguanylate cyclase [Pyrinomonadaceae bacterium]
MDAEKQTGKSFFSDYGNTARIFWVLMLLASVICFATSVYCCFGFSVAELITLAGSLAVAFFLNKYQYRIPNTQTIISAKEFVIFWGILWLGVPGGVFCAAAASTACFYVSTHPEKRKLFGGFTHIFSAFVSGNVFYFLLEKTAGFTHISVGENAIGLQWLGAALAAAVLTHFVISNLIISLFLKVEGSFFFVQLWKENASWTALHYFLSTLGAIIAHALFLNFGLSFGLFVLPMIVAAHFAYEIHLKRLAQKTKEISESSRIHLATVEALATAIDARDQVGIGHVRRTQIYAVGLGRILNLTEDEIQALNTGALLHDIGKLAVPDHILNKPGRLTPAEHEKTKIHASVGAAILEKIGFSYPVVPTVKYHHEAWDGNGYPEGLAKEEIPLTARILSVADAYDTLRGARPYRPPVSRDDARKFLLNGAGSQFDPRIIDLFLRNLRHFEAEIEAQGLAYRYDKENPKEISHVSESAGTQSYVEQIKRANREVFSLYELAKVFSSALNLQQTLSLLSDKISEFVPFDTCVIYLLEDGTEEAHAVFVEGRNSVALHGKRVKAGEGATGFVLKKRQSVLNINPGLDFSFSQLDLVEEYSAMVSLPLITDEKLIGAVSLYSCELENYEDEPLRLLETVSRIASDAIYKSMQHAASESRALTDPMTGLPNARSLQNQFEKEYARAARNGSSFQVLMLDLDGFKAVNDTFGHKAGDMLLKEISKVMSEQLRDYDFLARYAGDEFVAIIPETNADEVKDLCERMERAVENFVLPIDDENQARIGVSLGAACFPNDGETLDQLIIASDKKMYSVKAVRKRKKAAELEKAIELEALPIPIQIEENLIYELDESHIISSAIN